jgi:superfamily II DNA/RNA helicase
MPYIPFFSSFCQPDVVVAIVHLQDTQFKLEAGGMKVACLHGELSKMQRQQILAQFIDGRFRALVLLVDECVHL